MAFNLDFSSKANGKPSIVQITVPSVSRWLNVNLFVAFLVVVLVQNIDISLVETIV